tara:strand:+ start:254 stop:508 length:255 start_codon:yes stop_codon:yes gene_type:complete
LRKNENIQTIHERNATTRPYRIMKTFKQFISDISEADIINFPSKGLQKDFNTMKSTSINPDTGKFDPTIYRKKLGNFIKQKGLV